MSIPPNLVSVEKILWKFVRCCVNRAYAKLDLSKLEGDDRYTFENLLDELRSAELEWRELKDFVEFLQSRFLQLYERYRKHFTRIEVLDEFYDLILTYYLELPEVKSSPYLRQVGEEVRRRITELRQCSERT